VPRARSPSPSTACWKQEGRPVSRARTQRGRPRANGRTVTVSRRSRLTGYPIGARCSPVRTTTFFAMRLLFVESCLLRVVFVVPLATLLERGSNVCSFCSGCVCVCVCVCECTFFALSSLPLPCTLACRSVMFRFLLVRSLLSISQPIMAACMITSQQSFFESLVFCLSAFRS